MRRASLGPGRDGAAGTRRRAARNAPGGRQARRAGRQAPGWPVAAAEITKGLLLTLEPTSGHERQVADLLEGARAIVEDEEKTIAWFAIALPDGQYGIFDVFPDNSGRLAHLTGRVPRELAKNATSVLGGLPDMDMLNVLAAKLGD